MSLFETFKMDTKKELEGAEVKYAPNKDGTVPTFIVARASRSNVRYTKALERETRPYRRQIELETLDVMIAQEIKRRVFIEACLLGWSNVQSQTGTVIAYSADNATNLFRELPELFDDLEAQAGKAGLYRDEALESDAKN